MLKQSNDQTQKHFHSAAGWCVKMSFLWSGLTETAAETSLVHLNTEVDGREGRLLFAAMVKYLHFYGGLISMHVDSLSEISVCVQQWKPSEMMSACLSKAAENTVFIVQHCSISCGTAASQQNWLDEGGIYSSTL